MVDAPLWATRRQAEAALAGELKPFADLLDEAFAAVDSSAARLESLGYPFGLVCAVVVIKARNLGLGCYSLSLDAVAQEGGALFRPLIEHLELLTYFKLDRARVNEALEDRLPSAGEIARRIEGKLQGVRQYLNTHASHLSLSPESIKHVVDVRTGRLRPTQPYSATVLRENLRVLLGILVSIAIEAINCTTVVAGSADHGLVDTVENLQQRAFRLIGMSEP